MSIISSVPAKSGTTRTTFEQSLQGAAPNRPIPVHFAGCAGMLHRAPGRTGVIMLASFGYEAMAAHKTMRLLAEELADAGMPVLRFDPPGTGDSPGDEAVRELIASRSRSAVDACQFLLGQGNVDDVVFIGFGLGASIAAIAAASCRVRELVLIEPVIRGHNWLENLECLYAMAGVSRPEKVSTLPDGGREFLGYGMSLASCEAIEALALDHVAIGSGSRVLVLANETRQDAADLARLWRAGGACVDLRPFTGYPAMMRDPSVSVPPIDAFSGVGQWLERPVPPVNTVSFSATSGVVTGPVYKERPTFFGDDNRCFGILCQPAGVRKPGPAFILLNSGGLPHTGWGRKTVELARHLAEKGFTSFRIDVAGTGETPDVPGRPARLIYVKENCEDVVAAIDWLEDNGFERPAIAGVCSGAYLAFQTSVTDTRISAMLLLNMKTFDWSEKDTNAFYRSRGLAPPPAETPGKGSLLSRLSLTRRHTRVPEDAGACEVLQASLDRGVEVRLVYAYGDSGIAEMEKHLGKGGRHLRDYHNLQVQIVNPARHKFDTMVDRSKFMRIVVAFAESLEFARLRKLTNHQSNDPSLLPGLAGFNGSLKEWKL